MLLFFPLHFHCWVFADVEKIDAFAGRKDWCFCRDRKRLLLLFVFFFFSKTPKKTLTPKIQKPWKQNPKPLPAPTKQWKHPPILSLSEVEFQSSVLFLWFGFGFSWVSFYCIVLRGIVVAYVAVSLLHCFVIFFHLNFALHFWMVAFFSFFFFWLTVVVACSSFKIFVLLQG